MWRSLVAAGAFAGCALPTAADACGGFFCSGGVGGPPPVIQTGEKILFAFDGARVTAHVQILYFGDPLEFAWVVPTPTVPTLRVGSDQVFTIFDAATQPTFTVNWTETCSRPPTLGCASEALSARVPEEGSGGGVTVVSQQPVGPFDTAVLSAEDPNALKAWLAANGYDLAPEANPLIDSYVEKGDFFVALKLQSDRTVGDLQPIVLEYDAPEGPCVPIKLTAVAAQPDLGIAVFLLGEGRAVPANYLHLQINEAKVDWANQGANYPDVVTQAANEARGQGFVTDFSGSPSAIRNQLAQATSRYVREATTTTDPLQFVSAINAQGFLGTSQNVLALLGRCVPKPAALANVTAADFYANIRSFQAELSGSTVAQPQCADEFEALVVQPLREAEALALRHGTLTRLYTTMSADEMTLDPIFTFNPDLPPVAKDRSVSGRMICEGGAPVEVEYTTTRGDTFRTRWQAPMDEGPALKLAEQTGPSGPPVVVIDNRDELNALYGASVAGCSCSVAVDASALALAAILLALRARHRKAVKS